MNSEDNPYWKMNLSNTQYFPVKDKIVLGVRTTVFGMSLGMDFAVSNEDWAVAIIMTNSWR